MIRIVIIITISIRLMTNAGSTLPNILLVFHDGHHVRRKHKSCKKLLPCLTQETGDAKSDPEPIIAHILVYHLKGRGFQIR